MDIHNINKIKELHPKIRKEVYNLIEHINTKILLGKAKVRITDVYRSFEEQDKLYAKGRTEPGNKVTDAKAGYSFHNYGLAFDFCLLLTDNNTISWDINKDFDNDKKADWLEVVNVFKTSGWLWGGDWSKPDYPHLQKIFNYNIEKLLNKYRSADFIKGTKYLNI